MYINAYIMLRLLSKCFVKCSVMCERLKNAILDIDYLIMNIFCTDFALTGKCNKLCKIMCIYIYIIIVFCFQFQNFYCNYFALEEKVKF